MNPEEQGLKRRDEALAQDADHQVSEMNPEEQGLKRSYSTRRGYRRLVSEMNPEEQGLKQPRP